MLDNPLKWIIWECSSLRVSNYHAITNLNTIIAIFFLFAYSETLKTFYIQP